MIFLDVNTFWGEKAGGIKTYHLAKIEWFKRHPEHRYIIVGPAPRHARTSLAPNVEKVELFGPAVTKDRDGYRLLLDFFGLLSTIKREKPDVVETGDPWFSGPMVLLARLFGVRPKIISSFYHADPMRTYVETWAKKGWRWRRAAARIATPLFYALQKRYDITLVSSRLMEQYLQREGIKTWLTPFGFSPDFSRPPQEREEASSEKIKLLYAGRLDPEKGMDLLLKTVPLLLLDERFEVTVMGRGRQEMEFQREEWLAHPRYRFVGYLQERSRLIEEISKHHLLLSTCPWETFGLGVLEAFALGIPAVAPQQGGAGELVEELDPSLLYPPGADGVFDSPEELMAAINRALEIDLQKLSKRAVLVAQRYGSWGSAVERMVEVYRSEIGKERTA